MELTLAGEKLLLSEDKIIYWLKEQTVFIADLHLGKTTHFRKSGIAVPIAIIKAEISRIEHIIVKYRPKRIFFLGDLFHSDLNHEWNIFNDFLQLHSSIEFTLIKGNHDILSDKVYQLSTLQIEKEPFYVDPFVLTHHPLENNEVNKNEMNLCGHIHPSISLKGKGKSHLRLACFYLEPNTMVLPAFGRFTGLAKISPSKKGNIFAVLKNSVQQIGSKEG
ncbi:putative phosphoesterase [Marivirga sericea]|uniref:Putative phosphoesterase n=1 Tax=Marivirga sericea TaxID=1028 RepID=A0A1X7IQ34_9BACT|nr:ligase-associated DNA damage response endonuclease PdeM [Marivirga sericea]SMG17224.1 putative phosphoesterase [Marivirga sericea]